MKTMTCKQLGGVCDAAFRGNTFDEIAQSVQKHGMEMFQKGDADHREVLQVMVKLLGDPEAMKKWMDEKRREFEALPDDD